MKTLVNRSSSRKAMITLLALFVLTLGLSGGSQAAPGGADKPNQPSSTQYFQDVPVGSFFYNFTADLYTKGVVSGYTCGQPPAGPCGNPPLPYYLPNNTVTRGLMSIYVDNARTKPGISIASDSTHTATPLYATNSNFNGNGVVAEASGNGTGYSQPSAGLQGLATGTSYSVGVLGYSRYAPGGVFDTGDPLNAYGLAVIRGGIWATGSGADVVIDGNLTVAGSKTGYVVDLMRNDSGADLHPGDVVAFGTADAAPAILGTIPVANATSSGKAYNTAVLGVVDQLWRSGDANAAAGSKQAQGRYDTAATVIPAGAYMSVVTLGAYKAVKVNASNGPIHVGDLLTTSAVSGEAMRVGDKDKLAAFGAVIGKAMGSLDSDSGYIPVMVTLR